MGEPHYNFADLFEIAADKVPDRIALIDHQRRVTYRELDERANRLAHALQDAGVEPGDHVGIDAMNCIEWPEAALALYKLRAVPVNVNFRYVEEELRYLFENSDIVGIVYQREYGPLIAKARDAQPKLTRFWRIDDGTDADDSALDPVDFEAAVASGSPARDWPERSDDDIYLLYTGGTTGMPKGVMWRQEDVYYALAGGIDMFTNEKVTSPLAASEKINPDFALVSHPIPPLMHGAGQFATFRMLFEGGTLVYRPSFDAEDVWRTIEREKINVMMVTGDAMARPLADALERLQGRRLVVAAVLRKYGRDLLPDGEGATPCAARSEPRDDRRDRLHRDGHERHPRRAGRRRAEGGHHHGARVGRHDGARRRPATGRAGFGNGRTARARRQHPARLLPRSREDRGDVRHRLGRPPVVDSR